MALVPKHIYKECASSTYTHHELKKGTRNSTKTYHAPKFDKDIGSHFLDKVNVPTTKHLAINIDQV